MKRILLVIILLLLAGCNTKEKEAKRIKEELQQVRERVLREYTAAYPQEEFYFLYGPDYDSEIQRTNIRYRGILSTKTLEDLDYHKGFQINLEDVNSYIDTRKYKNTLDYLEIYAPLKKEAKEIFGEDIIFELEGGYTSAMHKNILDRIGKNMPRDKKTGLGMIILCAFVNDLDKELENIDYWQEKIYQLGKRYWEYYNVTGALQICIFDASLKENPKLTSVYLTSDNLLNTSNRVLGVFFGTDNFKTNKELNVKNVKYELINYAK